MPVFHPAKNLFGVLPGKTGDKRQGFIAEIIIQSNEFKKLLNDIDIEKINELSSAYKNVEEHINNPVKYNNFGKGLLNHIPSYMFTIEELINADKENNTNFADILINYISLNDYDKKIAFDLVQKLSERDKEEE